LAITGYQPGGANHITSGGNAGDIRVAVKDREVALHVLQLPLVVGFLNVVFINVLGQSQCGDLVQLVFDLLSGSIL